MKNWIGGLLLMAGTFLGACSNELDVSGPPQETVIVYGLLNVSDSVHYIKINKGFISDDVSPIELAKDPDQVYFDSLEVKLIDVSSGTTEYLVKNIYSKDSGIFNSAVNYLFSLNKKLTADHQYRLEVKNRLTGKVVNAETKLIAAPTPNIPSNATINSTDLLPSGKLVINFYGAPYSVTYEIKLRFFYEEIDNIAQTVEKKSLTWNVATGTFNDSRFVNIRLDNQLFYDFIASQLEEKGTNISRRGLYLEFEYWTADYALSTYRDVFGNPGIGIVQKKTDYTNINGGYGVFASRNNSKITGNKLTTKTKEQLRINPVMPRFNFVD